MINVQLANNDVIDGSRDLHHQIRCHIQTSTLLGTFVMFVVSAEQSDNCDRSVELLCAM